LGGRGQRFMVKGTKVLKVFCFFYSDIVVANKENYRDTCYFGIRNRPREYLLNGIFIYFHS
jgi:hypothetical protein